MENTEQQWQIVMLPLGLLTPHPENPRIITDDSVRELVESVQTSGIQIPLHVTSDGLILGGHRRHRAAQLARLEEVPCVVRDIPPEDQLAFMIDENVQRASLSPIEEAQVYRKLLVTHKTVQQLCRVKGFKVARVTTRLAMLKLPETVQQMYHENKLPLKALPWLIEITERDANLTIQYAERLANFVPLEQLKAEETARQNSTPLAPAPIPECDTRPVKLKREKSPREALLEVFNIKDLRSVYWQAPPFLTNSGRIADVSRDTCQECGNTDEAKCRVCPLYLFLKNLPVPATVAQVNSNAQ